MRTLTPILFLVVAGCFGANAKQGEPKKGEKVAEAKEAKKSEPKKEEAKEDNIVRPGHPVTFDGVKVELVAFDQEKHPVYIKGINFVVVKISNLTKSKIINFKSWSKDELSIVLDEFDNKYKILHFLPAFDKRIDPKHSHEETLFLEKPQQAAMEITVILRRENIGSKGSLTCKIPTSFISLSK